MARTMLQITLEVTGEKAKEFFSPGGDGLEVLLSDLRCEFGDCQNYTSFCKPKQRAGATFVFDPGADENDGWDINEFWQVWVVERGMRLIVESVR